jgi:hypothetical protein
MEEEMQRIWLEKFELIRHLKLDYLRLDFSCAINHADVSIGAELASMMPPFEHGLPRTLEVVATDEDEQEMIRQVLYITSIL